MEQPKSFSVLPMLARHVTSTRADVCELGATAKAILSKCLLEKAFRVSPMCVNVAEQLVTRAQAAGKKQPLKCCSSVWRVENPHVLQLVGTRKMASVVAYHARHIQSCLHVWTCECFQCPCAVQDQSHVQGWPVKAPILSTQLLNCLPELCGQEQHLDKTERLRGGAHTGAWQGLTQRAKPGHQRLGAHGRGLIVRRWQSHRLSPQRLQMLRKNAALFRVVSGNLQRVKPEPKPVFHRALWKPSHFELTFQEQCQEHIVEGIAFLGKISAVEVYSVGVSRDGQIPKLPDD
mmetsp:Transcript_123582/g.238343  ORF Transcript_123582/g.238343 Transcript_123582/m.238343 type:complete len:290 (-) Transcript_123582:1205-2074(-)